MTQDDEDFRGHRHQRPMGRCPCIGSGGVRLGRGARDGNDEYRRARRRSVRLNFYRNVSYYVAIVGVLAIIDWATGGGGGCNRLAAIWGGILVLQFLSTFVAPTIWAVEAEDRIQREVERRRGSVHVDPPSEKR